MSSVRAIAKKLNVSIATVSRALNNHPEINSETSARILKTANEIGYFNSVGELYSPLEVTQVKNGAFVGVTVIDDQAILAPPK